MSMNEQQKQLVNDNLRLIKSVARKLAKTEDDYEEFCQIGYFGLEKAAIGFDPSKGYKFSTYAVPAIQRAITNSRRKISDRTPVASLNETHRSVDSVELIDTLADDNPPEESSDVKELIQQLKYPYQQVLTMLTYNGLQQREVAEWLEVSKPRVSDIYQEAIAQLKVLMGSSHSHIKPKRSPAVVRDDLPYIDVSGIHWPEKRRCVWCDRFFGEWQPSEANTCSSSCAARIAHKDSDRARPWTTKEEKLLGQLAGTLPKAEVIKTFQQRCDRLGFPGRTSSSIEVKLRKMVKSVIPTLDNWTIAELARQLEVKEDRARTWVKRYGLPARKNGKYFSVRREDFRAFCKRRSDLLWGVPFDRLNAVVQDDAIAHKCCNQEGRVMRREIQRLDTKKVYPSVMAAARDLRTTPRTVMREIATGGWLRESCAIVGGKNV